MPHAIHACLLHTGDHASLDQSVLNLQENHIPFTIYTHDSDLASSQNYQYIQDQGSPTQTWQAILEATQQRPVLLLTAGESLSAQSYLQLADLPQTQSAYTLAVCYPDSIQYQTRFFTTQNQDLKDNWVPYSESAPWQADIEIQAQATDPVAFQENLNKAYQAGHHQADLCFLLGLGYFQARQDLDALKQFEALINQNQTGFWQTAARVMELKTRWELNQKEQVLQLLEAYRQTDPAIEKIPGLWILRGVIAKAFGQQDLALDCFMQARDQARQLSEQEFNLHVLKADITWKPLLGLAEIQFKEGLYSPAYLNFQEVLDYLPGNDYILTEYLKSAFFIRRYDTVQAILEEQPDLRGLSKTSYLLLNNFCQLQTNQGLEEVTALVETLQHEFEKVPSDPFMSSVLLEYAVLLLQKQKPAAARSIFQALLKYLPNQVMLWHNLAYSYFAEADYSEAEKNYRQALSVDPSFHESRFDLVKVLVMQERKTEAIDELHELQRRQPHQKLYQQAIKQLQPDEFEAYVPPLLQTTEVSLDSPDDPEGSPFIFVFPLAPTWENGIDIALKAFYQEFIAEDQVIFAIPFAAENEAVAEARQWAESTIGADLLPPVAFLSEPLPLLPHRSAWVLPFRVQPGPKVLEGLRSSDYPSLLTGMSLQSMADQTLPFVLQTENDQSSGLVWVETDVSSLQNQMRLLQSGSDTSAEIKTNTHTHAWLDLVPETQTLNPIDKANLFHSNAELPGLSVCMIVKDEADMLPQCLASLNQLDPNHDEIIIVDTGSQDQTREIAKAHPMVKLFEFEWINDFAAARNFALEQASKPWVLSLDADEYLAPEFCKTLKEFLANAFQPDAYAFPILAVDTTGQEIPDKHINSVPRCFKNQDSYRYRGRIHEMVYHAERSVMKYYQMPQLPIYHLGYQKQVIADRDKILRDTQLMENMIQEQPNANETQRMYGILANVYQSIGEYDKALTLLKQGLSVIEDVFILSMLQSIYVRLLINLKQYDQALSFMNSLPQPIENVKILLFKSFTHHQQGDLAAAIQAAESALMIWEASALMPDPLELRLKRAEILRDLARLYEESGNIEKAFYYFKRYLKLVPTQDNQEIFKNLQAKVDVLAVV